MKALHFVNRLFGSLGKNARSLSLFAVIGMASISFAGPVAAANYEDLGQRTITKVGCPNSSNVCFIALDGQLFGSEQGCNTVDQVRWDNGGTSDGKRAYATLLAAFLAGKKVDITIYGCTGQGYPELASYFLFVN